MPDPLYDGRGNVALLFDRDLEVESARYEYGPFGERHSETGSMALRNPFGFSTKYLDRESDMHYFGHRYYDASIGRWLKRDPIEEKGGLNLYGYVENDSVNQTDVLGLLGRVLIENPGPIWGPCGGFFTQWYFELERVRPYDGYIVQKIALNYRAEKCDGTKLNFTITYYEAHHVPRGSLGPRDAGTPFIKDTMQYESVYESKGLLNHQGEAKYYAKSATGDLGTYGSPMPPPPLLPWGANQTYRGNSPYAASTQYLSLLYNTWPVPMCSGTFPSMQDEPSFWTIVPQESNNKVIVRRWNCCCPAVDPNEKAIY